MSSEDIRRLIRPDGMEQLEERPQHFSLVAPVCDAVREIITSTMER